MTDIAIKPSSSLDDGMVLKLPDYGRPGKLIPAYLISLDGVKKGNDQFFIATKFNAIFFK